MNVTKR